MRCLRHHDQEAVGVCRHCGGGVCPDCATPVEDVLSCPAHVTETTGSVSLLQRNLAIHAHVNWTHWAQLAAFLLVSLGMAFTGALLIAGGEPGGWAVLVLSGLFMTFTLNIARWLRARKR